MRKTRGKRSWYAALTAAVMLCGVLLCACGGAEESTDASESGGAESPAESVEASIDVSVPEIPIGGESSEESREESAEASEAPGEDSSGEEIADPGSFAGKYLNDDMELVLYSDGSFLLETTMPLDMTSSDGKPCAMVYGYYGFFVMQGESAELWMNNGYFRGIGMENDDALAGEIAETLAGEDADRAVVEKWKKMLTGGRLVLSDLMSEAEIEALRKSPLGVKLDRENGTFEGE